jgi:sialidase-1
MISKKLLIYSLVLLLCVGACKSTDSGVEVSTRHVQVPLLKGSDNNPVLLIKVGSSEMNHDLALEGIQIDLSGCDRPEDIDSVKIFYLGTDSTMTFPEQAGLFGAVMPAKAAMTFRGRTALHAQPTFYLVSVRLSDHASLHRRIQVHCTRLLYDDSTYSIPVGPDVPVRQRIGVALRRHKDDGVHTYRIPGLATTNAGTLLAIYDVRRNSSRDLQGDIDIGVSRSMDGGNRWEPMRIALDMDAWGGLPEKFNGVSDACILVDRNTGKIFIAGLWMYGVIDENGVWQEGLDETSAVWNHQWRTRGSQPGFDVKQTSQFLLSSSADDGVTWSDPVNITRMCKKKEWWLFAPAPGHGIVLEDGTLVFPTQGRDTDGIPFSNITYSRDGGATWTTSEPAFAGANENMVVQRTDGSLMLNARYGENRNNVGDDNGRVVMITTDLGQTWSEHHTSRSALIEPTCMASLHRHVYHVGGEERSVLLFSNPNSKAGRHHMTIKVSFDDGETWPEPYWMLLDEGRSRGYSCITSIDERTVGILYEGSGADMTFESIPLEDLINPDR